MVWSVDPPASLIGAFAYDITALCLCRLPLSTRPLGRTQGWLLYALPYPAQLLSKGWVWSVHSSHVSICPQYDFFSSLCSFLTLITEPSPATWTPHPPLPLQGPHSPGQWGVCAGSLCPGSTAGTQTCSLMYACSQGSLKLRSLGCLFNPSQAACLPWTHSGS